jgi:transcriptional regulator with XRE-family HTH domain
MKKGKVTIGELSDATGIAEITINKLRNKQNINPTLSTLAQIANYFGITINDLLGSNKKAMPILNEDGTEIAEKLPIDELNSKAEFAIKIGHNNYPNFQKNTILLVNSQTKVKNGDYIVIQSNNNFIVCRAIIEPDGILGESLSRKENIYKIEQDSLLGVIVGGLWLRN